MNDNIHNALIDMTIKDKSEMKAINEQISAIIAKLHDKSNKKIEKQIHPMLVQIT